MVDLEKILDESKGADVGFYLLLTFSCVCPGLLVLFTYKPNVVESYEFSKLLLMCISISGLSVVLFLSHCWLCISLNKRELPIRLHLVIACVMSTIMILISLKAPTFSFFLAMLQFFWGVFGWLASISSGGKYPRHVRVFFNYGFLMFMLMLASLAEQIVQPEFLHFMLGPLAKHITT